MMRSMIGKRYAGVRNQSKSTVGPSLRVQRGASLPEHHCGAAVVDSRWMHKTMTTDLVYRCSLCLCQTLHLKRCTENTPARGRIGSPILFRAVPLIRRREVFCHSRHDYKAGEHDEVRSKAGCRLNIARRCVHASPRHLEVFGGVKRAGTRNFGDLSSPYSSIFY